MPTDVVLHIYDVSEAPALQAVNKALRAVGTGAFHGAVEVYGQEWSYGGVEEGTGVFSCPPKGCTAHVYRESVPMGQTAMSHSEVNLLLAELEQEWPGRDYDLLAHNCCHFSEELCKRLQVPEAFPKWVKSLAGAGAKVSHAVVGTVDKAGELVDAGKQVRGADSDEAYKIGDLTRGLWATGKQAVAATIQAGQESRHGDSYKFGDFSRGVVSKLRSG